MTAPIQDAGETLTFRRWLNDVYRRPRQPVPRPAKLFAGLPFVVLVLAAAGIGLSGYDRHEAAWFVWLFVFGPPAAGLTVLACRPRSWVAGALTCLAGLAVGVLLAFGVLFGGAFGISIIDVQPSDSMVLFTAALLGGAIIGAAPSIAAGHVVAWLMDTAAVPDRSPAESNGWERRGEDG